MSDSALDKARKRTGKMTGAEAIIRSLEAEDVTICWGIPGGAILPLYDAFMRCDHTIQHVLVRHEQGAGHMAQGYARATGKVGVCIATSGPGATNLVTPIADAFLDSTPLVAITGQVPTHLIGTDAFQEADTTGITRAATKHNYLVRDVDQLASIIHEAFHIATSGRPGPVVIDIPKDIQFAEGTYLTPVQANPDHRYKPQTQGDPAKIKQAAAMIAAARKPILYTGGGVINSGPQASELLREFAHLTGSPVTSTLMGLGAFPASDPAWLGMLGMHGTYEANNAMHDCDVMVCIGARFDDRVTGLLSKFAPNSKKIHIDIDPSSINKNVRVAVGIVGDCGSVLGDLIAAWKDAGHKPNREALNDWWQEIDAWRAQPSLAYVNSDTVIKPQYAIERLYKLTQDREVFITTEVGQHQMWAAQHFRFQQPNHWMTSGGLGTMGYGLPAAVGVQLAHPNALVVDIAGEASIQMTMQEISTAVQFNLPVKVFILNNEWMGMVRQWQQLLHGERYSHSYSESLPDFVKLAEAYGAVGIRCESPVDLDEKILQMINTDRPVIFDCRVEKAENCLPMIPSGKAHNDMILPDDIRDIGSVIDAAGRQLV